ncbi:hypothetical protein CBOM_07832 [Ceraceosorus bombacis]|uniref:Uncharacterized protein n=1 Tax=Ceraceosorus bombacis TaxID=401625 RepID=A0A0P1BP54_9BASI|nr:hypothetical protein CBOM_07832 [Ceraceosorus bombacis]
MIVMDRKGRLALKSHECLYRVSRRFRRHAKTPETTSQEHSQSRPCFKTADLRQVCSQASSVRHLRLHRHIVCMHPARITYRSRSAEEELQIAATDGQVVLESTIKNLNR